MTTNTPNRYSEKDLAEFNVLIEQKLSKARQELEFMQEQIIDLNQNGAENKSGDWFDDSSIHAEIEMLNRMVVRQIQFVNNLDNALIRIKNKTYGICSLTGQLISKERLQLVPHATKSVAAKNGRTTSTKPKKKATNKTKVLSKVLKKIQKNTDLNRPKLANEDMKWFDPKLGNTADDKLINMDLDEDLPQSA